jgi:hemerythrin superfamily protein
MDLMSKIQIFFSKGDNATKYQDELVLFIKIISNDFKSEININEMYEKTYNQFKHLLPEIIQEERNKKLKKNLK